VFYLLRNRGSLLHTRRHLQKKDIAVFFRDFKAKSAFPEKNVWPVLSRLPSKALF